MKPLLFPLGLSLLVSALTLACVVKTDPHGDITEIRPMEEHRAVESHPNRETPHMIAMRETVYVARTGRDYHRADCPHLQHSKSDTAMSRREAESKDYHPCKTCMLP